MSTPRLNQLPHRPLDNADGRDLRCSECVHEPGQHPYAYEDVVAALALSGHDVEVQPDDTVYVNFDHLAAIVVTLEYTGQPDGWTWHAEATEWENHGGVKAEHVIASATTAERCVLAVLTFLAAYDRHAAEVTEQVARQAVEEVRAHPEYDPHGDPTSPLYGEPYPED